MILPSEITNAMQAIRLSQTPVLQPQRPTRESHPQQQIPPIIAPPLQNRPAATGTPLPAPVPRPVALPAPGLWKGNSTTEIIFSDDKGGR
jgi:programmed cell death 6-interacting protein